MKVKIEICCDNAAFDENAGLEVCRILHELSRNICVVHGGMKDTIKDINGNTVGFIKVVD